MSFDLSERECKMEFKLISNKTTRAESETEKSPSWGKETLLHFKQPVSEEHFK